jgi:hypothetical protein
MDLTEIKWEGMEWINLAGVKDKWQAVVRKVMNFQVWYDAGNILAN